jgi:hypothetical protein
VGRCGLGQPQVLSQLNDLAPNTSE